MTAVAPPRTKQPGTDRPRTDQPRTDQRGVAVVMPAYREAANLAGTVEDFLDTLEASGHPHSVIVVNDGSPDATGDVAEVLASQYPGRVEVVHHEVNQGYGSAVRTGIQTALERTPHKTVFLTDSDGQFHASELPEFLDTARRERADAVVGYRRKRADSLLRRTNGYLWTQLSRMALRVGARDVDCAYKLIDRTMLQDVVLTGQGATISPEIMAKVRRQGARVLQRPVQHYPRQHGEQTGANPLVILRSLYGLARMALARHHGPKRDPVRLAVTFGAIVTSIAVYAYFQARGDVLAYTDAISHLLISRRVVASPTPGVAQLGAVWLPLPHLLTLPFVGVDSLFYSGFAGSVVSMGAYVLGTRYVYMTVVELTANRAAGVIGAATFALCPNVLYMQSTPMGELTLLCAIAGGTYHLVRWSSSGRHVHLAAAAWLTLLGTLSRYEGWVFACGAVVVIAVAAWRRAARPNFTDGLRPAEAHIVYFGLIAFVGMLGWVLWNAIIFGDATFFYNGQFSDSSLWKTAEDVSTHSWWVAIETYWYAVVDNVGVPLTVLGLLGCALYLMQTGLRPMTLAPLTPLVLLPFFVNFLHSGERPLLVMELVGHRYNVRFGLIMIIPIALFLGHLVGEACALVRARSRRLSTALAGATALLVVTFSAVVGLGGVATLEEATAFRAQDQAQMNFRAAAWLRSHYDGGRVLMDNIGNESVTMFSHVPTGDIVYDGSYRQWDRALVSPKTTDIRWIVMREALNPSPDRVWLALHGSPVLAGYQLVYKADGRYIYRLLP